MTRKILFLLLFSAFTISCSNPPSTTPEKTESDEGQVFHTEVSDSLFSQVEQWKGDLISTNTRQDNKLKIIDDRTKYIDSVYFELVSQITKLENDVRNLQKVAATNMSPNSESSSFILRNTVTDEEFRTRYIDALASYQNGNYDASLNSFSELLSIDKTHELSDNCQYWIGEIQYARKDFRKALSAFIKTLEFPSTNKADHAQYKIGLCYLNIGDAKNAIEAFEKHIAEYPNSEHYRSSVEYINNNK